MAGFGETLHQARAHMGVTLKEAEQATRINRHNLAALEAENFSELPPLIYQRGAVRTYATYLQLDPGKLLAMFEEAHGDTGSTRQVVEPIPPIDMPSHWAPNFAIISFALVLGAIVFTWVYSAFVAPPDSDSTPTIVVPTATPFDEDIPIPTRAPTQVPPTPVPTEAPTVTQSSGAGVRETSSEDGQSADERRGGDNQRLGTDPEPTEASQAVVEETAVSEVTPSSTFDESELTSIMVSASEPIYVTITADGAVVFDGNLATGQSTGHFAGNTFQISTSWGEKTLITNACGVEFLMGYETGSANYELSRNNRSCPPIR